MLQVAAPVSASPSSPRLSAIARRRREREAAKAAMVVTLGAVTVTGLMLLGHHRSHKSAIKSAHIVTGAAVLGASWWHYSLYGRRAR